MVRQRVRENTRWGDLGQDIRIHGSRALGTARRASDVDIAIVVSSHQFDAILSARLQSVKPNGNTFEGLMVAGAEGRIFAGEIGFHGFRKELQRFLRLNKVDISIVRAGGNFDRGPYIPLAGG